MDTVGPEARSRIMAAVRSSGTKPEVRARRLLHAAGLRFRANVRGLPGTPDVVLPGRGAVVFVDGCFWHGCPCSRVPDSDFWRAKIARNRARDRRDRRLLRAAGWRVFTVRECRLEADVRRVALALGGRPAGPPPCSSPTRRP